MNAGLRLASPFTSAFPPSFGAGLRRLGMLVAAVALVGCGDSTPGKPPAPPTTPMVSERCVMPAGELAALGKGISVGQQDLIDIKPPHGRTLTVTACVDLAENTY